VLDLLSRLHRERGVSVVLVLHDLEQALVRADRVAVFARGRLYAAGPPASVLTPETLADVFGIEVRTHHDRLDVVRPVDPIRNL
jgi:iron complex transport system ATP-binding protein